MQKHRREFARIMNQSDSDRQAAYAAAAWPQRADLNGSLLQFLNPPLESDERQLAAIEGWIFGVV
jgi:hypothetical protein